MEKTLNSKLLDFQKRVGIVKKDSKNPHFKNTYASLTQILSEVKPLLTECGLVLVQPISLNGVGTTIIDCETNEKIETVISLPANLNPQQLGSAITYFRRYTLASLLALEIDDDDAQSTVKQQPIAPQPTVDEVNAKIINAKNLAELQKLFLALPVNEQKLAFALKEQLKAVLK
jgi:hypothetical protein